MHPPATPAPAELTIDVVAEHGIDACRSIARARTWERAF